MLVYSKVLFCGLSGVCFQLFKKQKQKMYIIYYILYIQIYTCVCVCVFSYLRHAAPVAQQLQATVTAHLEPHCHALRGGRRLQHVAHVLSGGGTVVCVCVCVCVGGVIGGEHIHTHTHTHTYTHTRTHTHARVHTRTHTHTCSRRQGDSGLLSRSR